jgi:hypothetical protein
MRIPLFMLLVPVLLAGMLSLARTLAVTGSETAVNWCEYNRLVNEYCGGDEKCEAAAVGESIRLLSGIPLECRNPATKKRTTVL